MAIVIGLAILFFALGFLSGHLCTYEGDDFDKKTEQKREIKNLKNAYQGLRLLLPAEIVEVFEGKKTGELMTAEQYFKISTPRVAGGKALNKELEKQQTIIEKLEAKILERESVFEEVVEEKKSLEERAKSAEKELKEARKTEKPEVKKLRGELALMTKDLGSREKMVSELQKSLEERSAEVDNLKVAVASLEKELAEPKKEEKVKVARPAAAPEAVRFDKYIGIRGAMEMLKVKNQDEFMKMAAEESFPRVAASFGETKLWLREEVEDFAGDKDKRKR